MPATARAGFFDKLKEATNAIQQIKHDLTNKPASKPTPANQKPAANPQQPAVTPNSPASQPPAVKPAGTQSAPASSAASSANPGPVTVAKKVVGPLLSSSEITVDNGPAYTVSLHGSHLAAVHMHGSRYVVSIDGVDGPRVEAILSTCSQFANSGQTYQDVAMSDDGKHYAYLARARGKLEVFEDGKRILQFPQRGAIQSGNNYLFFSPHGGAHLFFAAEKVGSTQMEMWVDGKPVPSFDGNSDHPFMITFSPDGKHYLYAGYLVGRYSKPILVVDGKKMDYPMSGLAFGLLAPRFIADSQHVIYVTSGYVGKVDAKLVGQVLVDGKPVVTGEQIESLVMSPKGSSYAAVVSTGSSGYAVFLNGKEVPNTRGKPGDGMNNSSPVAEFSPDGKHLAVACNYGAGDAYVVLDGKRGDTYDQIFAHDSGTGGMKNDDGMKFSADSQSFGYFAGVGSNTKTFVVVDGNEYDQVFDGAGRLYFSPEGHHVAIIGEKDDVSGQVLYIDGKLVSTAPGGFSGRFAFDRDGSHWMIHGQGLVVDGRTLPFAAGSTMLPCRFSPDGTELAIAGVYRNQKWGLFLYNTSTRRLRLLTKGMFLGKGAFPSTNADPNVYHVVFSPDSQHLYYVRLHQQQATIYVDGEKTAAQFDPIHFPPFGNFASSQKAGCWYVGADDTLHALCAVGNEMERITITPPPGGLN